MTSKVGNSQPFGIDIDIEQASRMLYQGAKGGTGVADGLVKSPNPIAMGINTVVGGLGLPPIVGEAAKLGVGIALAATGVGTDPLLIADGALGVVSEGLKIAEPYVEYPTGNIHVGTNEKGQLGYSIDADWDGGIPISYKEELYVGDPSGLLNFFAGMVGGCGPSAPGGTHEAKPVPGIGHPKPDDQVTKPAPPPGQGTQPQPAGPTEPPAQKESPLAGDTLKYYDSMEVLLTNFDTYDAADIQSTGFLHKADGGISFADLQRFMDSNDPKVRDAALFLIQNPEYFGRTAGADGMISKMELRAELHKLDEAIRLHGPPTESIDAPSKSKNPWRGVPPDISRGDLIEARPVPVPGPEKIVPPPAGPPSTNPAPISSLGSEIKSILNDPTLSTEEKIQRILMAVIDSADAEELALMEQIGNAAIDFGKAQDAATAAGGKGQEEIQKKQKSLTDLQFKLQKTVERRKQMFDLMSNMSVKNNEMAKTAIQNLARA